MQDREKKEEHREKNIGLEGRTGLERRTGLETDRQEDREEKLWREAFYQELDAVKRQQMLKEREEREEKTKKRCICRKSYGIKIYCRRRLCRSWRAKEKACNRNYYEALLICCREAKCMGTGTVTAGTEKCFSKAD